MTITAVVCTILAIALVAGYAVLLHNTKEPDLTDDEYAEMGVDHEWWHAD